MVKHYNFSEMSDDENEHSEVAKREREIEKGTKILQNFEKTVANTIKLVQN